MSTHSRLSTKKQGDMNSFDKETAERTSERECGMVEGKDSHKPEKMISMRHQETS